jgi:hypothetical protein
VQRPLGYLSVLGPFMDGPDGLFFRRGPVCFHSSRPYGRITSVGFVSRRCQCSDAQRSCSMGDVSGPGKEQPASLMGLEPAGACPFAPWTLDGWKSPPQMVGWATQVGASSGSRLGRWEQLRASRFAAVLLLNWFGAINPKTHRHSSCFFGWHCPWVASLLVSPGQYYFKGHFRQPPFFAIKPAFLSGRVRGSLEDRQSAPPTRKAVSQKACRYHSCR